MANSPEGTKTTDAFSETTFSMIYQRLDQLEDLGVRTLSFWVSIMRTVISKIAQKISFGLARKLMLVLSSVIVLCAAAVLSISVFVQTQMIEDRLNLNAIHLAALIKEVSIPAILRDDPASVGYFFEELEARTDIVSVSIVDPKGWLWQSGENDPSTWLAPGPATWLRLILVASGPRETSGDFEGRLTTRDPLDNPWARR